MKFCYNLSFLPFLKNPKDLDLSYKTDLDFWDCFGGKKPQSCNRRNMVIWYPQNASETWTAIKYLCLLDKFKQEGQEALTRSPEYIQAKSQTFNFEI